MTLNETGWVKEQYKTPGNLQARMQLHVRFSTNPYPWLQWVFDRLQLPADATVLELGCGPGTLWQETQARRPVNWRVTLTDLSAGMVTQAWNHLGGMQAFRFAVADAQQLPFASGTFDAVIANHMLYHVPDRVRAFGEIQRVLRPQGRLFAATNDLEHMREIRELGIAFRPEAAEQMARGDRFPFAIGLDELSHVFGQVQLHRYPNQLIVTDADALAEYMLSGVHGEVAAEDVARFRAWLAQKMAAAGGEFTVTSATGLFEATTV